MGGCRKRGAIGVVGFKFQTRIPTDLRGCLLGAQLSRRLAGQMQPVSADSHLDRHAVMYFTQQYFFGQLILKR